MESICDIKSNLYLVITALFLMDVSYWITITLLFLTTIYIACSIILSFKKPKINISNTINNTTFANETVPDRRIKKYEFLVDFAQTTYSNEVHRITNLDNKANTIIGFISVAISILIGFGALEFFAKITTTNYLMIYSLAIGTLVFAIFAALYALKIRTWDLSLDIGHLYQNYMTHSTYASTLKTFLESFEDPINRIGDQNDNKAKWIQMSWYLILLGLNLIFIFFILTVFTNITNGVPLTTQLN